MSPMFAFDASVDIMWTPIHALGGYWSEYMCTLGYMYEYMCGSTTSKQCDRPTHIEPCAIDLEFNFTKNRLHYSLASSGGGGSMMDI